MSERGHAHIPSDKAVDEDLCEKIGRRIVRRGRVHCKPTRKMEERTTLGKVPAPIQARWCVAHEGSSGRACVPLSAWCTQHAGWLAGAMCALTLPVAPPSSRLSGGALPAARVLALFVSSTATSAAPANRITLSRKQRAGHFTHPVSTHQTE